MSVFGRAKAPSDEPARPSSRSSSTSRFIPGPVTTVTPALALLLATAFAAWLYGWRVIDPSSHAWLLHGDPAQHYIGSVFFLSEPWQWPPGAIHRFGADVTSVVFTDSIPLLALPAKLFGVAPSTQYFGLWMLACHALAAWFGARLLQSLGVRSRAALAGAMLLAFAPSLLLRAYGHEALMGQFIVIAAIGLSLQRWRWRPWVALATCAVLVHPYFAAMIGIIGLAAVGAALHEGSLRVGGLLLRAPLAAIAPVTAAWAAGYFVGTGQLSADGHAFYSANLLTWIDPMDWAGFLAEHGRLAEIGGEWSRLLPAQRQATAGQYEGFAYLGAGVLLLVALALARTLARTLLGARPVTARVADGRRLGWLLAACIVLALVALSARPSFGSRVLVEIPLSESAQQLLGIFRASGRFVWPLGFLLSAWAIAQVARRRAAGALLLLVALALQFHDLSDKLAEFRERFRTGPAGITAAPSSPAWGEALQACTRLDLLADPTSGPAWITPALAAAQAGAELVEAPTARRSPQAREARDRELASLLAWQGLRDDTVYVLPPNAQPMTPAAPGASSSESESESEAASIAPAQPIAPPGFHPVVADAFLLWVPARCGNPSPSRTGS